MSTFITFILHEPEVFPLCAEHLALMIGFIGLSFMASTFLSASWIHTTLAQAMCSAIVLHFYGNGGLKHNPARIAPALAVACIGCGFNSYFVELNEKKEFLENLHNSNLQRDLKKVLQTLPEAVMIYKKHENPHIKLWNKELERLFGFQSLLAASKEIRRQGSEGSVPMPANELSKGDENEDSGAVNDKAGEEQQHEAPSSGQ